MIFKAQLFLRKAYYLNKLNELFRGIRVEYNEADDSWQVMFPMLTEDCLENTPNVLFNAKSIKVIFRVNLKQFSNCFSYL